MRLYFKNYDNGWKWLKMIGAMTFVIFFFRVIQYAGYANQYRVGLLEIMVGNEYELVLLFVGLAAYIIGKWKNYTCELYAILNVRKYSQVKPCLEEKQRAICEELLYDDKKKEFTERYYSLNNNMQRALYLKKIEWDMGMNENKPQWMSQ